MKDEEVHAPVFDLLPVRRVIKMNVGGSTDHTSLAGAITRVWETSQSAVELSAMGRDAVYQALQALPIVNGNLAPSGVYFLVEPTWNLLPFDPFNKAGAKTLLSSQTYQAYEKGGTVVHTNAEGSVIRFSASGPEHATELWKQHPRYSESLVLMVLKTVITFRLIPVRRG